MKRRSKDPKTGDRKAPKLAESPEARRQRGLADLAADFDERLKVLNEPGAHEKLDAVMKARGRMKRPPRAGESISDLGFANARAAARQKSTPRANSAVFDKHQGKVVVELSSGLTIAFKPADTQGLETAKSADLAEIEISPSGFGLHFPELDVDLYIPALLEGFFGSKKWTAAHLSATGGRMRKSSRT